MALRKGFNYLENSHMFCIALLKGWPAYVVGQEISNKFLSNYDTVTLLLVYHKYLEIGPLLEYDARYRHKIHSHLSESEFCHQDSKALK